MKALIDRTTYKTPTPNFGIHTQNPLVYFIDIPMNLELQRFLCPVDLAEFEQYLYLVKKLMAYQRAPILASIDLDEATDEMADFLNEKSKDWYPVDENNNKIEDDADADLKWNACVSGFATPDEVTKKWQPQLKHVNSKTGRSPKYRREALESISL